MRHIIKKTIIKSRDKLLSTTLESINSMSKRIDLLDNNQVKANQEQREQSRHILTLCNEVNEKLRNSGTIRISETEILTKTFTGLKIYLDPKDISVTPHLALDSIWEYNITYAWLSLLNPNDTVLDIGANFGYFGALAAQKTEKKNSKVIFFEANPNLLPYIKKTLSVNWLNEQSIVENLAVADKPGKVTLNVLKDYIGSSSLHTTHHIDNYMHNKMHKVETESSIEVDATTIDEYCKQNRLNELNLIKMDIEGFEDKAYQGMREMIRSSPRVTLFVEFTKDSYEEPKLFYNQMLEDFGNVYLIDQMGKLVKPKSNDYESVIGSPEDWIMPVFSKISKLEAK